MEQDETLNRLYSYVFYALGVVCIICAAFLSNAYLVTATSVLLLISALYLNSGHIINNILVRRSSIIEVYNGYKLSNNLDSAVKRIGERYRGVSIALLRIEKGNNASGEAVKGLIESLRESFEFGISVREADRRRIIESLDTRRRMKEISLSRMDSKRQDKINALKREIDLIGSEIQSLRKSGKALEVVARLSSFEEGESEAEAGREASSKIKHIADAFSAALGVEYDILRGEELLNFLEAYL